MKHGVYVLTALLLFAPASLPARNEKPEQVLVCYSLAAAQRILAAEGGAPAEVKWLGGLSRPLAVITDGRGDLILLGERDPQLPGLRLDDVVMALRSADSLEGGNAPGVSIDPENENRDPDWQTVRYFGGIEHTHYGRVCYEADLLLKKLAFGFAATGLYNAPNEWDLLLERVKSGFRQEPWVKEGGRSWFFPSLVRVAVRPGGAVMQACKMAVMRADETEGREQKENEEEKSDQVAARESLYDVFVKMVSDNYDSLARQHPVLVELRRLTILSALMKAARELPECPALDYWRGAYHVARDSTPARIPTLRRGVSGLAYGMALSGGVIIHPEIYRARAGDPAAIRTLALRLRPSPEALTWSIPLAASAEAPAPLPEVIGREQELVAFARLLLARGEPQNALAVLKQSNAQSKNLELILARAEAHLALGQKDLARSEAELALAQEPGSPRGQKIYRAALREEPFEAPQPNAASSLSFEEESLRPVAGLGWLSKTAGKNLFEFSGWWSVNYGAQTTYYPRARAQVGGRKIIFSLPLTARLVLKNRWEIALTAPFEAHAGLMDFPSRLPGINDVYPGYVAGLGNPFARTQVLLLDGLWERPSLVAGSVLVSPWRHAMLAGYASDTPEFLRLELGGSRWQSIHTLDAALPLSKRFQLLSHAYLTQLWGAPEAVDELTLGYGFRVPLVPDRKWRMAGIGLLYERLMPTRKGAGGVVRQFSLFIEQASRDGVYPASFGVSLAGEREERVYSIFSSTPMRKLLWSPRKWF